MLQAHKDNDGLYAVVCEGVVARRGCESQSNTAEHKRRARRGLGSRTSIAREADNCVRREMFIRVIHEGRSSNLELGMSMPGSCVAQPNVAVKDMERMSSMGRRERAAGLHALLQNRIVVVRVGAERLRREEQKNDCTNDNREQQHTHTDYLQAIAATDLHSFYPRVMPRGSGCDHLQRRSTGKTVYHQLFARKGNVLLDSG